MKKIFLFGIATSAIHLCHAEQASQTPVDGNATAKVVAAKGALLSCTTEVTTVTTTSKDGAKTSTTKAVTTCDRSEEMAMLVNICIAL